VDDENLSPFDTLPDSDLLSDQRGREHSPVSAKLSDISSPNFVVLEIVVYLCLTLQMKSLNFFLSLSSSGDGYVCPVPLQRRTHYAPQEPYQLER